MSSTQEPENIRLLFQHQYGFVISKVMFTACELGIFDLLTESGELLASKVIAERLGSSSDGMERMLDTCVSLRLLRMERKNNEALYGNTDLSSLYLAKSSPKSQYPMMKWLSEVIFPSMGYLGDAVREGKNQADKIYDHSSNNFFEALYRSEEKKKLFLSTMNTAWSLFGKEVLSAFDLSPFPLIYDLGGGGGALAKECASLYPNSTVAVLDLPNVVEAARKLFVSSEEPRITFHEGDFLKGPIPEADLYILARTVHHWDDEMCVKLLSKVHKACKPGGGVLVVEIVLSEDRSRPLDANLHNLLMLLHTEGKERTLSEYSTLLRAAGFKEIQMKKRSFYDAVLGRK
ncbi:acetylserotonin O-methyltransferase-like isoform X2 [Hemicordylus capensis]|uniref:acetylserotonin O-methyltransferase-like isoform X2 n=1 Tax=Hemicordylus capensis TaxID=884348 RepID=UPI002303F796|nr:acetylserotonin O-methyltransferase-like isoform X2 [Hemicordylus capensis]XP_053164683.1 acetylserotonin O-methyltransferase-like isoform X2 [Hemicordylus capensis]